MNITGAAIDWIETLAEAIDDPESRPAGYAEPHYSVSEKVTVSRDGGLYVYHLSDDQLGQGSSLGNARVWAETKGFGEMLSLFSIETGTKIMGGMSLTYLLPFSHLSTYDKPVSGYSESVHDSFARAMPSAIGAIHLHPAYQQHEFIIGDGLHILETFFVPRTGMNDLGTAQHVVSISNRTPHPIGITVVASAGLRGETPRDMKAIYDHSRGTLIAWNESKPEWVRVFGGVDRPKGYWATTDEEEAYSPGRPLPNKTDKSGDLTGSLQFDMVLYPRERRKIRIIMAFSPQGRNEALSAYDSNCSDGASLKHTIEHYTDTLNVATVEMPDNLLTHGVQWAKACLLRPFSHYKIGEAFTNDPGHSSNIVGRDMAWYIHGSDFVKPEAGCSMLRIFAGHQREDGLIPEYINGNSGKSEDFGFNINDNTPLFLMAVAHHIKATAHWDCLNDLYESACKAGECILAARDENGLIKCTADGLGPKSIVGWRNVLQNEQITGVVTEVNSECYAALQSLSELARLKGYRSEGDHYADEAEKLKHAINKHLINPKNGLYVRNIDLMGNVFTQATADLVFPLICGVADADTSEIVNARLAERDFMSDAGIRVLPIGNPHYDPSFESGCLGGVWPGVTWWYSMSAAKIDPKMMAESLKRAYSHYVANPKVYNTVPGQFSEWSDGQTLVNRGMRLSPWEPPRYIWAAVEGLAGIKMALDHVALAPELPPDWMWLRVHRVSYRDGHLSYFLTRESDGMHVYTSNSFTGSIRQHHYEEELQRGPETITTGISTAAFRNDNETLICLGSNLTMPAIGPFLAHHALNASKRYDVSHLNSHEKNWEDIGTMNGSSLQRIAVRVEGRGYALYRFSEVKK